MENSRTHSLQGKHVLVVEDNELNRLVMQGLLKKVGIQVTIAVHGQEAVEMLRGDHAFDLVLMDIQMPVMGGHEATRIIRQELKCLDLPIVGLTAHALNAEKQRCLDLGMDDFLTKPVFPDLLYSTIERFVKDSKQS